MSLSAAAFFFNVRIFHFLALRKENIKPPKKILLCGAYAHANGYVLHEYKNLF